MSSPSQALGVAVHLRIKDVIIHLRFLCFHRFYGIVHILFWYYIFHWCFLEKQQHVGLALFLGKFFFHHCVAEECVHGSRAPTYRPAVELSGAQFEIASGAQFENALQQQQGMGNSVADWLVRLARRLLVQPQSWVAVIFSCSAMLTYNTDTHTQLRDTHLFNLVSALPGHWVWVLPTLDHRQVTLLQPAVPILPCTSALLHPHVLVQLGHDCLGGGGGAQGQHYGLLNDPQVPHLLVVVDLVEEPLFVVREVDVIVPHHVVIHSFVLPDGTAPFLFS
ncbi:hypothetical protein E2C01_017367 [Portunus trituberculatus]|uniref:Uncharacterized protein n=1 Tax=Portunus trituberculatus TaxID=210409 RepID=A0A5B7DTL1_PORTR|nr:hypothetical protein [Portunus trituberculatus]